MGTLRLLLLLALRLKILKQHQKVKKTITPLVISPRKLVKPPVSPRKPDAPPPPISPRKPAPPPVSSRGATTAPPAPIVSPREKSSQQPAQLPEKPEVDSVPVTRDRSAVTDVPPDISSLNFNEET